MKILESTLAPSEDVYTFVGGGGWDNIPRKTKYKTNYMCETKS
jgi:hypothetical protein